MSRYFALRHDRTLSYVPSAPLLPLHVLHGGLLPDGCKILRVRRAIAPLAVRNKVEVDEN